MRKLIFAVLLTAGSAMAQVVKDYDPQIQRTSALQYFKPAESHLFTGDCMPYYHDGTFYVYWLLDEGHHSGLGGLGGHQWALSTSEDLVNWTHYPVAVGIEQNWEKSICTGSVIHIINRLPEKKGDRLVFFLKNGNARFGNITLSEWDEEDWK